MGWRNKNRWAPYRSGLEKSIAEDLKARGIRFEYEGRHLQFAKRVNRGKCDACGHGKVHQLRTYTPDFEIWLSGGRSFIVESKGNFPQSDRAKMLAVKAANPDLDIRLIFAANNKLQKGKDDRYSDWATKHGFEFHVGKTVPEAWIQSPDLQGGNEHNAEGPPTVAVRRSRQRTGRRKSL